MKRRYPPEPVNLQRAGPNARAQIIDTLRGDLRPLKFIRAAWLAGSDANGRTDRYSDIDLCCIVKDAAVEAAKVALRRSLAALSPIDLEWAAPQPTWHGHDQLFFRLRYAGPHLFIDAVIIKVSTPAGRRFLEKERHGTPVVLFDKDGLARPQRLDVHAHDAKMQSRLDRLRLTFPLFQTLVIRAIKRRRVSEAVWAYHNFTLLPLVEALRIRHCPERFDFGLRYLQDDLPVRVYKRICGLSLPRGLHGPGGIATAREKAEAMFEEATKDLHPG